jgi:type III secretion system FlhB-like substrate exporter
MYNLETAKEFIMKFYPPPPPHSETERAPRIVLVGISSIARRIVNFSCVNIVAIWDEDLSVQGLEYAGIKVTKIPQNIDKEIEIDYIVVTGLKDVHAIYDKLDWLLLKNKECKEKIVPLLKAVEIFKDNKDFYKRLKKVQDDLDIFQAKTGTRIKKEHMFPMLFNYDANAGNAMHHYFYQDLWAAKKIYANLPNEHYDIGSRIDGFILAVLSFMPVTLIDIRPLPAKIAGLSFIRADATSLSGITDNSIFSLSSLCAIEHFGLGGYGGSIDPEADKKVCFSIARVLRAKGKAYISVPVGRDAVAFNGHRIYNPYTFVSYFRGLKIVDFSVIRPDEIYGCVLDNNAKMDDYICCDDSCMDARYYGLFEFMK